MTTRTKDRPASKPARLTVTVPSALLAAVDECLVKNGESRSAVVRRLLEEAVWEARERAEDEQYIRAYREQPQTEDELGWVDQVALQIFAENPWE